MKILHYINQFFAGIGGEDRADVGLEVREGPVGPGMLLASQFPEAEIVTVVCGDNHAAEHLEAIVEQVLGLVRDRGIDIAVMGPAFNAGRYGLACGELAASIPRDADTPAITGLFEDNAAVSLYRAKALIVRTAKSAAGMRDAILAMSGLIPRLIAGEVIDDRDAAGLFATNARLNRRMPSTAADRAVDMLLALLAGDETGTELAVPDFEPIPPPPAIGSFADTTVALVTEGGLTPKGNPDGLTTGWSERWASYPVADLLADAGAFEAIHGGYDTRFVNESPFRLVPADVVSDLVAEGVIGSLHPRYFVTAGMATPVENARKMGGEIAEVLKNEGVQAVIFTST